MMKAIKTRLGQRTLVVAAILATATLGTAAYAAVEGADPTVSVNDVEAALATHGYEGTIDGVPGLIVFIGSMPAADLDAVTISRWEGTPDEYAAIFLDHRTKGVEEEGKAPEAWAEVSDSAAYGSTGDVPFAMEWAAVQVGNETVLIQRAKSAEADWIGLSLIDTVNTHLPVLEAAGFDLRVTAGFEAPGGAD